MHLALRVLLRVLILVPAVLVAGRTADARAEAPEETLRRGEAALAAERYDEAERLFRDLVTRQPGLIDAYRGLSHALSGQERRGEAAEVLRRLGEGLLQAGRHGDAVEVLTEAVGIEPTAAGLHALLGKAHLFAQNHTAAIAPLERALELGERSATSRLYLAAALWEVGRPDESEAVYRRLVAQDPDGFVAVHQLGRLLVWQGRHAEAVAPLRRAAAMRPTAADVTFDLAQALAGAGESDEALAAYRRTLELMPSHYKACYGLARLLARRGDREAAVEAMAVYQRLYAAEQEKTRRESLERARLDRGWDLIDRGAYDEAVRHFDNLEATSETLAGAATAWSRLGDHERAAALLERAVGLAPERQDLRLMLAEERMAKEGNH